MSTFIDLSRLANTPFGFFILFWIFACWDKQEIDLLRPEIPHYILSGFTVDIDDSTQLIPNTPLTLTAIQMLYDVTFDPVSIESDSNGYFQIDSVYPGNYIITGERDGYNILVENLTIEHKDRLYNIELPKTFLTYTYYRGPSALYPVITFAGNSLWVMGNTISPSPPQVPIPVLKLYSISFNGINYLRWIHSPYNYPGAVQFANSTIHFYSNGYVSSLRPEDQTVWNLVIADSFQVQQPFTDLTWDGTGFWTTSGQSLQSRGNNLSNVEGSWQIGADQVGALFVQDQNFWVYDQGRDLLLKLNDEKQIAESYRLINWDTHEWISVFDMSVSSYGALWVTDQNTTPLLHVFDFQDINNNPERHTE